MDSVPSYYKHNLTSLKSTGEDVLLFLSDGKFLRVIETVPLPLHCLPDSPTGKSFLAAEL